MSYRFSFSSSSSRSRSQFPFTSVLAVSLSTEPGLPLSRCAISAAVQSAVHSTSRGGSERTVSRSWTYTEPRRRSWRTHCRSHSCSGAAARCLCRSRDACFFTLLLLNSPGLRFWRGFDALWPSSSSSSAADLKAALGFPLFFSFTLSILTDRSLVHQSGDTSAARRAERRHERSRRAAQQIMESERGRGKSREKPTRESSRKRRLPSPRFSCYFVARRDTGRQQ